MKKGYIVAFLAALALCMGVTFAACGERGYVSGDEVGTYYNDDFGSEYIITLAEKGAVEFQVDGVDEEGSYTLEGAALTISLDGREDISAEFSDRTIKLNFNGKEMVFLEKITYKVTFETNGGQRDRRAEGAERQKRRKAGGRSRIRTLRVCELVRGQRFDKAVRFRQSDYAEYRGIREVVVCSRQKRADLRYEQCGDGRTELYGYGKREL